MTTQPTIPRTESARADMEKTLAELAVAASNLVQGEAPVNGLGGESPKTVEAVKNYLALVEGDTGAVVIAFRRYQTAAKRWINLQRGASVRASVRAARLRAAADKLDGGAK